jgi:hypothetical protein
MNPSRYYRPWLAATAAGLASAGDVVRGWVAALDARSASGDSAASAPAALRLLALVGRSRRVPPGVLAGADPGGVLARAEAVIADRPALVAAAVGAADPDGWVLRVAAAGESRPAAGADAARDLIDAFDDYELVWAAARAAGADPAELRERLDAAAALLAARPDVFLPAAVFTQAVGATIRPDLDAADPLLGRTAGTFAVLLDAIEAAEADARPLPPLGVAVRAAAPPVPAAGLIPPLPPEYAIAAGAVPELPPVPPFRWRSPDGAAGARLDFPTRPPPDRLVHLRFRRVVPPAGARVLLGGLRGVVTADGRAGFDWEDVRAVEPILDTLLVGDGRDARWIPEGGA